LAEFPNEGISDWQWHDLCAGATTFDLTGAPAGFRPIVQPVPDFHFHTLLAHVFEARVGNGSLLVCGYDLTNRLESRPAARQFRGSLLRYVGSDAFRPSSSLSLAWLTSRCDAAGLARRGAQVTRVSSEDRAGGNVADNILDGDPATFWHTRWQPQNDPMPHELLIDLGRPLAVRRVTFLPRQDQSNGRIAAGSIFACRDADDRGTEMARLQGSDSADLITVDLQRPVTTRFLRLVVESEVNGQPFASLAELDVVTAE
jgi:hypothetical protein